METITEYTRFAPTRVCCASCGGIPLRASDYCSACERARVTEPSSDTTPSRPLGERLFETLALGLADTDPMILMMLGAYAETIKGLDEAVLRDQLKKLRSAIDELLYR